MTKDGIDIKHREYVGPLLASTSPTIFGIDKQFKLNPGYTSVFPWLAHVARNYESYRFKRVNVVVQNYMSAMRDGIVNYCVDYDAGDVAPTSLQEMLSNRTSGSRPVGAPFSISLDVAALNKIGKNKFVRALDTDTYDTLLYDSGTLFFNASVPTELASQIVANIFIEYDVELRTPQVKSGSSTAELKRPTAARMAMNPTTANVPVNDRGGVLQDVGEVLKDMFINNTGGYTATDYVNYGAQVLGGTGQNINIPNLQNIASTIMSVVNNSEPTPYGETGSTATYMKQSWKCKFLKSGCYLVNIILNIGNGGSIQPGKFRPILTMTSTSPTIAADVLYADPDTLSSEVAYARALYSVAIFCDKGDVMTFEQGMVTDDANPSVTSLFLNRILCSAEPIDTEQYNYELRTRNIFPTITGGVGTGLCFSHGATYGLHSTVKVLDGHKFMAFDPSVPTTNGKYPRYIEDYLPLPADSNPNPHVDARAIGLSRR